MNYLKANAKKCFAAFKSVICPVMACVALVVGYGISNAYAVPTDIGVPLETTITDYGTQLGGYVLQIVGLMAAFSVVFIGMKWLRRAR